MLLAPDSERETPDSIGKKVRDIGALGGTVSRRKVRRARELRERLYESRKVYRDAHRV
jgi:hypothetical protein